MQQILHTCLIGLMDHVALDHQIFINEFGRVAVIGNNSTNFGSRQNNHIRPLFLHKSLHGRLIFQIKLAAGAGYQFNLITALQLTQDRAPHHAAMSGYINAHFSDLV